VRHHLRVVDVGDVRPADDHVLDDDGGTRPPGEGVVALLALAKIELSAFAEVGIPLAGLRVQRDRFLPPTSAMIRSSCRRSSRRASAWAAGGRAFAGRSAAAARGGGGRWVSPAGL
jgi:hypothetical protein